jgi:hypothetical protein
MPAAGTRKGFKFVPASSKPVVTEKISFDEVEKESTTTPGASRKRAATKAVAAEAKAAKLRKTGAQTSMPNSAQESVQGNKQVRRIQTIKEADAEGGVRKVKAHYPTIDMPFNKIKNLQKNIGNGKSHAQILDRIVVDVCEAERAGLETFFESQSGSAASGKGREAIHDFLLKVLDELPSAIIESCPEDVEFLPEFVSGERTEVAVLTSVLEGLRQHSAKLAEYEADVRQLAKDHDMWLEGPPKSACQSYNKTAPAGAGLFANVDVPAITANYSDILDSVQQSLQAIITRTAEVTDIENKAAKMQEKLYKLYNRSRLETGPAGVVLPAASTKNLLRGLAKF